jgi:hypothetical protein
MLVKLVQQVQAGLDTLRTETQAGFAALHAEQADNTNIVRSMGRSVLTLHLDVAEIKDQVRILTAVAATDEHPPAHPRS